MKVKVNEIPEGGLVLTESFDPVAMNMQTPNLTFVQPLRVTANFQKERDAVVVDVDVNGSMETVCGRCLETSRLLYGERFHLGYSVRGQTDLDVTDDIRQEIIVNYPMRPLCKENCLGLCPRCGKNLNEGPCGCP
ncbi:MAG: DUF177 domain-containing protein [Candidatus Omnitrophica bacterium]|nr:DUF177 domain-containing protein [Candidatus Omnitrophota bacterium]